jgi:hypothetical protein
VLYSNGFILLTLCWSCYCRQFFGGCVRSVTPRSSQSTSERAVVETLLLSSVEDRELDSASEMQLRAMDADQGVKDIDGVQLV